MGGTGWGVRIDGTCKLRLVWDSCALIYYVVVEEEAVDVDCCGERESSVFACTAVFFFFLHFFLNYISFINKDYARADPCTYLPTYLHRYLRPLTLLLNACCCGCGCASRGVLLAFTFVVLSFFFLLFWYDIPLRVPHWSHKLWRRRWPLFFCCVSVRARFDS